MTKLSAPMNGNSVLPFALPVEQEPLHEVAERLVTVRLAPKYNRSRRRAATATDAPACTGSR